MDVAAVGMGDGAHDGESEPGSAVGRGRGGVDESLGGGQPAEGLEQARDLVGRDGRSGVVDGEPGVAVDRVGADGGGSGSLRFLGYFVAGGRPLTNSFGLGNWTGLAALVIVVGLLALSTDGALRELKARRWKRLQRLNYALFALVVLHAYFYGALLRSTSPFTLLLLVIVTAVFLGQATGIWLWRRRRRSQPA
jgi:hypothetical protein